jgi:hypothetical protein
MAIRTGLGCFVKAENKKRLPHYRDSLFMGAALKSEGKIKAELRL